MELLRRIVESRERRSRSPEFQDAINREKREFSVILSSLGNHAFDLVTTTILKTPTGIFLNALKLIYKEKYKTSDYAKDVWKLFFGKNGVAHRTLKVSANALHLAGQGVKIGVRELFKL